MRVIAGKARRIQLKTIEGMTTRPTTDRIKETLFNMLSSDIGGCCFLDLFSGSGAIGIEALSRGARMAIFVENNRQAVRCIEENLEKTRLKEAAQVLQTDCLSVIKRLENSHLCFDIVFMDPPYNKEWEKEVLKLLKDSTIIHENSLIIVEASLETEFDYLSSLGFSITKQKKYKTNQHLFIKKGIGD